MRGKIKKGGRGKGKEGSKKGEREKTGRQLSLRL